MPSKKSRGNALFNGASRRQERDVIDALAEEVATLREENQRLAREHFRPASASRTAAEIRKVAAVLDEHPARGDDGADSAVAIALETEMIRRGLVEVCELLQTMAAQLAASLTNGVPLHEIDRRLRDRPVEGERRRRDGLTNGATLTNGMLTNGMLTNASIGNGNGNGNGHSEISVGDSHSDAAVASVRSNGTERHLQVLGEGGEPPMMIVKGTPGASDWESPRSSVYDRVARADNAVAEPVVVEDARPNDSAGPLARSGYYERVQRSDGSATR
jgi:hypothetical protein